MSGNRNGNRDYSQEHGAVRDGLFRAVPAAEQMREQMIGEFNIHKVLPSAALGPWKTLVLLPAREVLGLWGLIPNLGTWGCSVFVFDKITG